VYIVLNVLEKNLGTCHSLAWSDRFFPFVLGRGTFPPTQHKRKTAVWSCETKCVISECSKEGGLHPRMLCSFISDYEGISQIMKQP